MPCYMSDGRTEGRTNGQTELTTSRTYTCLHIVIRRTDGLTDRTDDYAVLILVCIFYNKIISHVKNKNKGPQIC